MATIAISLSGIGVMVKDAPSNWPNGVNFQPNGKYGAYLDIPLTQAAKSIGFLLLDESKTGDDVKIQSNDYKLLCLFPNNNIANNKKSDASKDIHIFTDGSLLTYRLEANKNKDIKGFSQQDTGVDYTKKAGIGYFIQNGHQFTFGKGYISPYEIEFNIKKNIEEHLEQLADNDDSTNEVAIPYRAGTNEK